MKPAGRKSITYRLTLLFAFASTAVLLVLGLLIGNSVEQHFEEQDMEVLTGKLELTRHALERVYSQSDLDALPQQLDDSLVGHHGLAVVVVAPSGQTLFATSGAEFPQALLAQTSGMSNSHPIIWKSKDGVPLRGISEMVQTGIKGAKPAVVAVATDISHHEHFMSSFRTTLWLVVVLAALITGLLGWMAARRGLAPLHAIKREAAAITVDRLHSRLPTESIPIELVGLADTLNQLLARLEDSFRRLSDFSSDIAHELRTPISNLMTETQVVLAKDRSPEEYRETLASNAEEYERLSRMITDMLFLAQADHGLLVLRREPIDLGGQVKALFEFFDVVAEEKNLQFKLTGNGEISGDRLMLQRALANLIANAIRHSPANGTVSMVIERQSDKVRLCIENSGEPIPAEYLKRIFDRFYRIDPSRHREGEGAGLGLAITRSIVHAHGGTIDAYSEGRSIRFELCFPLARHG